MKRAHVGWALCGAVLVSGILIAAQSSANRARGNELDRLERWCEAQARRNELARTENQRREWQLLGETRAHSEARRPAP